MQQERRKRRQTDRESLEQIRKRHQEVTAAFMGANTTVLSWVAGIVCSSNAVDVFVGSNDMQLSNLGSKSNSTLLHGVNHQELLAKQMMPGKPSQAQTPLQPQCRPLPALGRQLSNGAGRAGAMQSRRTLPQPATRTGVGAAYFISR